MGKRRLPSKKKSGLALRKRVSLAFLVIASFLAAAFLYSLYMKTPAYRSLSLNPFHSLGRGPKLTFVIDDMGYSIEHQKDLEKLGRKVTYAVLPLLRHSRYYGELGRKTGAEVILHLPLESAKGTVPGRGLITTRMSSVQILETLDKNLSSVPNLKGANNHMGSLGTRDPRVMKTILGELKKRDLFYLDSLTTAGSLGVPLSREIGLRYAKRDVFLDNVDEPGAIRAQIRKMAARARQQGHAVGIGHYRANTLRILDEEIRRLESEGFQVVPLRRVLS